ncbi:LysM peptidoglycan-binding domain-containing protein [Thiocystis violascens]|uniref:LysM peptidoglycan-binding domain-containing protein n=1 Tax=Thiocystis violascens TaxID=73141 RepID=UPI00059E9BC4|nr:LysM peptidoglycan-binding domain-containing protein [Thiocystis violascens]
MLAAPAILLLTIVWTDNALSDSVDISATSALASTELLPSDENQAPLEELRRRIAGMEGKLKESANARKNADQARMEAERHLAEGLQQIEQLRRARDELEHRLNAREAEIARLTSELSSARQANAELNRGIADLQRRLPVLDGGSLTAEDARQLAVEALAELRDAKKRDDRAEDRDARLAEAEQTLRRRQFRLASVIDAQSVYRVRPNDTLALIGNRFYGSGQQWRALFEANRHVIEDPDRLTPGITLVIP